MILKRKQAIRSILELAEWISEEKPDSAYKFIESTEKTFHLLEKNPEIGRLYRFLSRRLADVRVWRVAGFENFLIFYRPQQDGVEILDVIHGARDLAAILEDLL